MLNRLSMVEATLMQGGFKLFLAVAGLLFAMLALRWMDRTLLKDTPFSNRVAEWSDHAQALYFSGRLIAVALVIGLALS